MSLELWAAKWHIPASALLDLPAHLVLPPGPPTAGMSEAGVQSRVRIEAAKAGMLLWRNNVGVLKDDRGVPVRYGLANDSRAMNTMLKSADLVGIRPVLVEHRHVGTIIGQFVSYECKHGDWKWSGNDHELAQQNWAALVKSAGGHAVFTTGGL